MDLNLLVALDALLTDRSVTKAAGRLNLSAPAMSRTLGRIRHVFKDPILVRAGRGLVPTPRAEELRHHVHALVESAQALLRQEQDLDLSRLERAFTIRTSDALALTLAPGLLALVRASAPGVRLRFAPEGEEDVEALRDGRIDIDVGVIGEMGPEIRVQALFRDRFVGVVRQGHPLFQGALTPQRFAACEHIAVSRRGRSHGPIDARLEELGLSRTVVVVTASIPEAIMLAAGSDLVASVPECLATATQQGMAVFPLPVQTGSITISQAWHPRFEADKAHGWLRSCLRQVLGDGPRQGGSSG
jgi:DNA-binding transcriptional LysR family regulator